MSAVSLTLAELAGWIDGEIIRGEPGLKLTGMAALDAAGPGDASFYGNEKYARQFQETKAAAVVVARGVTGAGELVALIAVDNPTLAFSKVVEHFAAKARTFHPGVSDHAIIAPSAVFNRERVCIHAGAVVMDGAVIGEGTEIGANVVIGENVRIGADCRIMANVSIREACVIGNRVHLQPGAVIGADGFGYQLSNGRHTKIEQLGIVEIHDDVEIGSNTTVDRARFGKTIIGEGTKIDNLVQIGHNVVIGKHCLVVAQTGISGSTKIGDYCTFAGQVGIVGHIEIADNVTLSARAGATCNIPQPGVYAGRPAAPFREDTKKRALTRRLPELYDRVTALEKQAEKPT
ncbi:MAG: UDP-3-O-(3-hydroxymyristoyl)glucosamine N-acyltransferase [Verrucomicrobiota bacterium]